MKKKDTAREISAGLFINGIDLILFAASLGLNLYSANFKAKDPFKVLEDSFKLCGWFQEKLLQSSSAYAKQKGYLERRKLELTITQAGKDRLKRLLPRYQTKRPWDGRLHLITYDVKEKSKKKRYRLMRWLIEHHAVMLQKSVWVSVIDLEPELRRQNLIYRDEGLVICSAIKSGEGINNQPIKELIGKWYRLDELNRQYDNLISFIKSKKQMTVREKFIYKMRYLRILKDDPQLPFELLEKNPTAEIAYKLVNDR